MRELVFETAEQRKKKAEEPDGTTPGYPREETVVGTEGDLLILKYSSPTRFEVWKDGKYQRTFS